MWGSTIDAERYARRYQQYRQRPPQSKGAGRHTVGTFAGAAVKAAVKGEPGITYITTASGTNWRAEATWDEGNGHLVVIHHATAMLTVSFDGQGDVRIPDLDSEAGAYQVSLGYGSVSDQQGMNQVYRDLGLPWYYARNVKGGGPRIEVTR